MTSRNADSLSPPPDTTSSRRCSKALAGRGHKSSDRLHRLGAGGGSSTHLSNKRSKSYTQVAQQAEGPRGKAKKNKKKNVSQGDDNENDNEEEGWTSASAAGTPDHSMQASPAESDEGEDDADEGLVIASKRKADQGDAKGSSKPPPPANADPPSSHAFPSKAASVGDDREQPATPTSATSATAPQPSPSSSLHVPPRLTAHSRTDSEDTLGKNSNAEAPHTPEPAQKAADVSRDQLTELRKPTPLRTGGHERINSNASMRTLTGASDIGYGNGSPGSFTSRVSLRSRTLSLKPRDSLAAAPPMLSTENAMANTLAPGDDDVYSSSPSHLSRRQSRTDLQDNDAWLSINDSKRRHRQSSVGSVGSFATLPNPDVDRDREPGPSTMRIPSSATESNLARGPRERTRTQSSNTNSLTAADAAKLAAKLRQARDAMDEQQSLYASGGLTSRVAALAHASATGDVKYHKAIISTFSKDQERIGKPIAAAVTSKSVFAQDFTIARQGQGSGESGGKQSRARQHIRYVARFGLSGPRITKSGLNEALLAPSFDGDEFEASWAPALANAAGLGPRSSRLSHGLTSEAMEDGIPLHDPSMAFTGSAAVNGPNATPVHLIHGLTTTSAEDFPLDPADTPTLDFDEDNTATLTADPETLRAIALTSQMLSTHRSHTMTRRYYDPIRESIDRCAASTTSGRRASLRDDGVMGSSSALAQQQRRSLANKRSQSSLSPSLAAGADDSGGSIKGIKRVWSSRGIARTESSR